MLLVEWVAVVLLLLALPLFGIALRRRLLTRHGGTIDLSLRLRPGLHGRGWSLGLGRFTGDDLQWFRVFSLSRGPRRVLTRRDLAVVRRRQPTGGELMLHGQVVMECLAGEQSVELAMQPAALTGFLAWLEARPPGATLPV